jgi:large subunit ribosomal protein L18
MATVKDRGERRTARVRRTVKRAAGGRARLSIFRSSQHIYAQIIDDEKGETIAAASSIEKEMRTSLKTGADVGAAKAVGKLVAERALGKGVAAAIGIMVASRRWRRPHARAVSNSSGRHARAEPARNGTSIGTSLWHVNANGKTANLPTSLSTSIAWPRW